MTEKERELIKRAAILATDNQGDNLNLIRLAYILWKIEGNNLEKADKMLTRCGV